MSYLSGVFLFFFSFPFLSFPFFSFLSSRCRFLSCYLPD